MRVVRLVVVLAALLSACGGAPVDAPDPPPVEAFTGGALPDRRPGGPDTLVAAVGRKLVLLDPHKTPEYPPHPVLTNLYDTLVEPDPRTLRMRPSLATDWYVSTDRRTWTFTLRDDVRFHDGSTLDAADVVYSLRRVIDEQLVGARRLSAVSAVEALGGSTVQVRLSRPTPDLLARLGGSTEVAILPEGAAAATDLSRSAVGTGPFMLSSMHPDVLRLRAFEDHWGPSPAPRSVVVLWIEDPNDALAAVRAGVIDWTDHLTSDDIGAASEDPEVELGRTPSVDYWYLALHHDRPPFDDVAVRRALATAIDRRRVADAVGRARYTATQTAIPASSWWSVDHAPFSGDQERARRLLRRAGVESLSFALLVSDDVPHAVRAADAVARQLATIGVDVRLERVPLDTWLERAEEGRFDGLVSVWLNRIDPHGVYHDQHRCDGSLNRHGYCDPRTDELLVAAGDARDPERRRALYDEVGRRVVDDVSYVHLAHTDVVWAWSPTVSGVVLRADRMVEFETMTPNASVSGPRA